MKVSELSAKREKGREMKNLFVLVVSHGTFET
jgi:hypothetical protein